MPKRKRSVARTRFVFDTPRTIATASLRGLPRSSATRSHAAYWGGAREDDTDSGLIHHTEDAFTPDTVPSDSPTDVDCTSLSSSEPTSKSSSPTSMLSAQLSNPEWFSNVLPSSKIIAADLFGTDFIGQIASSSKQGRPFLVNGYSLVAMAYSMATTSRADRAPFLNLKEQLLRNVSQDLQERGDRPSLQSMGTMLLLGTPIVCLLSRYTSGYVSRGRPLDTPSRTKALCFVEPSVAVDHALEEKQVHWRALYKMVSTERRRVRQAGHRGQDWLEYVSRYVQISLLFDNCGLLTELCRTTDRRTTDEGTYDGAVYEPFWASPLTVHWLPQHLDMFPEDPVEALSKIMHDWLATFLDHRNEKTETNDVVLGERRHLRQHIEHWISIDTYVSTANTAMWACCRWTASIMLAADQHKVSISEAAQYTAALLQTLDWLKLTDLDGMWDGKGGILYWVVCVCHIASIGQFMPLLTTALLARFAHIMALSRQYHAIALVPLTRLYLFERQCCASSRYCLEDAELHRKL